MADKVKRTSGNKASIDEDTPVVEAPELTPSQVAENEQVVADNEEREKEAKAKVKGLKYFRNPHHPGQKFVVGEHEPLDPSTVKYIRFLPWWVFNEFGERVKVGYLKTSDADVIERCKANPWIEEIDKKQYDFDTDEKRKKRPAQRARL